ncbi:hypothetical protein FHS01_001663 [Longimicrobium terrae]|uniref:Uncharacterized protein n=1 Tax=Longimicrobium terrae TaxID=1639882 RepID=A0A841GX09_9BACT|nr:hypothetical protein [Longimicrobium terrae]MBB6070045.1 hypothetical protein [Longimicrobium terrae]
MVMKITRYVDPDYPDAGYLKIDGSEFPVPRPESHRQILDLTAIAALAASTADSGGHLIRSAKHSYVALYQLEETWVEV